MTDTCGEGFFMLQRLRIVRLTVVVVSLRGMRESHRVNLYLERLLLGLKLLFVGQSCMDRRLSL